VRTQDALFEWVQPKAARAYESIDEIHERLVITAANAVQLGADDDDDEHERRAEKLSAYTPFSRRKVRAAGTASRECFARASMDALLRAPCPYYQPCGPQQPASPPLVA
jgi:hypothetical protein